MNRTSSTGEFARVGAVLSTLFSTPEGEAQDRWGQAVARTIAAAVSAANAVLVVGFKHATQMYGKGVAEELNRTYTRPTSPDDSPLFQHPHTGVWCRRADAGLSDLPEQTYDRTPVPGGHYDAVGLTVDIGLPGARATVSCHHHPALTGEDVRRQTRVLEMLRPALAAGVRTRIVAGREQTALTRLVDALGEGAALYSSDGTVLHQNFALTQMMAEDPERGRLWRTMSAAAREAGHARVLADRADRVAAVGREVRQDVRIAGGRHRVRARVLASSTAHAPGLVAVLVDRAAAESTRAVTLQKQFGLTDRELDVTHLLSMGKSNADIARALGISPYTARHHTESVLSKLGVRSRAEVPRVVLADGAAASFATQPLIAGPAD